MSMVINGFIKVSKQSGHKAPPTAVAENCRRGFMPRLLVWVTLLFLASSVLNADEPTFQAGAYAIDITPEHYPVPMVGSMTPKFAHSAHDPLHARCLVLDDGETQIAFAIVDSCLIPRDIWDAAKNRAYKATGIPVSNMLGAATHTHTAVCVSPAFQSLARF